ncbi:hypothetical protein BCR34DRAFT_605118 [Clohesyomyces aquaticus]|uniref:Uncharacterized protein n=1 Tax=Clohesyomyces aquaticus TaxID=1231657 RepID=A0A1Y1Z0C7_9PLEO|nr:hypothetical protein BCR34DRAFT_605118 [Clohesyomyces aquaticus]
MNEEDPYVKSNGGRGFFATDKITFATSKNVASDACDVNYKKQLSPNRKLGLLRERWHKMLRDVDFVLDDVYVNCGILKDYHDLSAHPHGLYHNSAFPGYMEKQYDMRPGVRELYAEFDQTPRGEHDDMHEDTIEKHPGEDSTPALDNRERPQLRQRRDAAFKKQNRELCDARRDLDRY